MAIGAMSGANPADRLPPDTQVWRQRFGKAFDAIADKLGMTKSELISALQSGQKMKDLEAAKGVTKDDVIKAAADALKAADPSLSADAATKLATSYYDGKAGHYQHQHHEEHRMRGTPPGFAAASEGPENPTRVDVLS